MQNVTFYRTCKGVARDEAQLGSTGSDRYISNLGAFHFYLNSDSGRITDFSVTDGDTIWLSAAVGPISSWVEGDSAFISLRGGGHVVDVIELRGMDASGLADLLGHDLESL